MKERKIHFIFNFHLIMKIMREYINICSYCYFMNLVDIFLLVFLIIKPEINFVPIFEF